MTPAVPMDWTGRGILLVTGKGGTGKTTVSVAVAQLAATQGRRVVLVEVDNHRPSLLDYFRGTPSYEPHAVAPNLDISNITWIEALADWLTGVVPAQRVVRLILSNRMVRLFLDVTPGSREMVVFARLLALRESYDLVVVDLPASGHAVSFFLVPYRALSIFFAGPIRLLAERIVEELRRETTRIVLVSLPEEMVINETIETWHALRDLAPELTVRAVILNQALEPSLSEAEQTLLRRLEREGTGSTDPLAEELVRAGRWEAEREATTADALDRIGRETTARVIPVPLLASTGGPATIATRVEGLLRRSTERSGERP